LRRQSRVEHWDQVARGWSLRSRPNELLAEHGRRTHLALLARWADVTKGGRILKTDLFEVAFGPDPFLLRLAQVNSNVIGIDISKEVVHQAKKRAEHRGVDASQYLCSDVRHLPLQDNSIDLVISDSTLDHFPSETDIVAALKELRRVLRVGGTLILTMDNKSNLTYPPYIFIRLWMRLGLAPYFIGITLSPTQLRRALEEIGFGVEESTAIFHCPHPDALVRWLERQGEGLGRGRLDNAIRKGLAFLDKLEGKRTKYLTGRYIVVKAVKRQAGQAGIAEERVKPGAARRVII